MAKNKTKKNRPQIAPSAASDPTPPGGGMYALRETIESIVIAFVLALLFRTFEAEAFVIPTGSMSPALQGQHKDVDCTECGYRFRATASTEGEDRDRLIAQSKNPNLDLSTRKGIQRDIASLEVVTGMCPMCRQTMAMRADLPEDVPQHIAVEGIPSEPSYPGDRILVNKFAYTNSEPQRWDVIVFKFPGDGEMNYIKRLIGLPNETLRIQHGDIFIRDDTGEGGFQIERKPADKVPVMLQAVHDTDYDPSILFNAGWPLRWQSTEGGAWQVDVKSSGQTVEQQYRIDAAQNEGDSQISWLRYRHFAPRDDDWAVARSFQKSDKAAQDEEGPLHGDAQPELIRDFNPYNTGRLRGGARRSRNGRLRLPPGILEQGWETPEDTLGLNWVADLAVDCEVDVEQAQGTLVLDLVEAGQHFTCQFDLKSGEATVAVTGHSELTATAKTSLKSAGTYQLRFANVDDQLLLWVNDELVKLAESAPGLHYDADQVFEGRENAIPKTSDDDLGDLAPIGIGASGAKLKLDRIQVLRDIYYIATDIHQPERSCDYPRPTANGIKRLFTEPSAWSRFSDRKSLDFPVKAGQLFVMGDNSPQSQDCRLWAGRNGHNWPGGSYLDRRLLIGKAICVFWPHSWGSVPGLKVLPGFPGFGDMRLVR